MVRLVGVEGVRGDAAFLEAWRRLERSSLEPNPFFAPQMVLPATRYLEGGAHVRLLVDDDPSGRLRFLLPVVDTVPWDFAHRPVRFSALGVGLTGLRTWLHSYSFLGTPLLDADADPAEVWRTVLAALPRAAHRPWLELPTLATDGAVATALAAALGDDWTAVHRHQGTRGLARRRPEATYVQEWVSGKNRANLARRRRNLAAELGSVTALDRGSDVPDLDRTLDGFLDLEERGWKGRGGSAVAANPRHTAFVRETLRAFADDKRLVLLSLESPEETVAQSVSLIAGRGQFGFKKAYDERWHRHSPGALLDVEVIEEFHRTAELEWIDTCSDPARPATDFFGDKIDLHVSVIATSRAGRAIVPRLFPRVARFKDQWRGTRAGNLLLRAIGRRAKKPADAAADGRTPIATAA